MQHDENYDELLRTNTQHKFVYKDNKQLCDYNSKLNIWAREAQDFFCFYNRFHCQLRGIGGRGGASGGAGGHGPPIGECWPPGEFFEKFGETLHI